MKKNNVTLKSYFETGDYPTESQFIDLIDSFLNIEENDAVVGITDNGDGTYTFQLLNSGDITVAAGTGSNTISIADVTGLQAILDTIDPANFLLKNQDETTSGSLIISMSNLADDKAFSIGAPGNEAYLKLDGNGSAILGNLSSNDGQNSFLIIRRNGNFELNDNGTIHTVWHSGNDGGGSGLDADTLDGLQASVFVRNDGNSGTRFGNNYLQFNGDGGSNNDYIAFNDSTNGFYFNADRSRQNTAANANIHANDFYATGTYIYGDGKRIVQFSDAWLRLNPSNNFTNGIYCGSGVLRTDGQFECGPSGADFKVTTSGVVTAAGTMTADNFILSSDKRLKSNIKPLKEPNIHAKWVSFDMKGEERYGVVAQELEEVHPEFVKTDEKGYKSVAYIDLLVAKNAELEARIEKLESLIKTLV